MKERFEGPDNRSRLISELAEQHLMACRKDVAEAFIQHGSLVEYATGTTLIEQHAPTSDVLFIISGKCNVIVGQTIVATRGARDAVGEMVIVDPAAPRSTTVRAAEPVLVLTVPGRAFEHIADQFPTVWRASAKVLAQRLREREKFHRQLRQLPITFVGSSSESVKIAQMVQSSLQGPTEALLWNTSVFNPSGITIEVLTSHAAYADFAVIVMGPDDKVISRRKRQNAPRDNVIFELGLFMGALGRHRTFMIHQRGLDIKIPTDLLGVTRVTYRRRRQPDTEIAHACADIIKEIQMQGPL